MWTKIFGKSEFSNNDFENLSKNKESLELQVDTLSKNLERQNTKFLAEKENMKKEMENLKQNLTENRNFIVILTQKSSRKKSKIQNLRKKISELEQEINKNQIKISECDKNNSDLKNIIEINEEKNKEEIKKLQEKYIKWEEIENMKILVEDVKNMKKNMDFLKGTIFTENLLDNIIKLKEIIQEKILEYNQTKKEDSKAENIEDFLSELKNCQCKTKVPELEAQISGFKDKIEILERKEKLLNKMLNSTVFYRHIL